MVYIREITIDDIEIINSWRNDKNTIDLLGANFRYINLETDKEWINNYQKNRDKQVRCSICIDKKIIGLISLTSIDNINRKSELHVLIGDKDSRGKGYGKKSIQLMLNHAFNNLNLNKVYLTVLSSNFIAKKLYSDLGFKEEGVLRKEIYKNGDYVDCNIMSILKEEFLDLH